MSWTNFGDLDLSAVEEAQQYVNLDEGEHAVKCTGAEIKDTQNAGGKSLVLDFQSTSGMATHREYINVANKSDQAQQIGRRTLKSFLTAAGHPNPDKPGDVASLVGLECKIVIKKGKAWTDKTGATQQRNEIKVYSSLGPTTTESGAEQMDDEIPF